MINFLTFEQNFDSLNNLNFKLDINWINMEKIVR